MAELKLLRGNRAESDAFTGALGELVADTSTPELRIHDGIKPGGHRIVPLSESDLRYQSVSAELTQISLLGDGPGALFKRAPGDYRIRKIDGTPGQVVVTDGDGFNANPVVALPATITANLTLSGVVTFTQALQGNVVGNVTGNLTGDSAGVHTGAVIGDVTGNLTGDAAGNHTGTFTGDVDSSGGSLTLGNGQVTDLALASAFVKPADPFLVPSGGIILWSGAIAAIPVGWFLCDGGNGTPDLRENFVLGAGVTVVGVTGGSATHVHAAGVSGSAGEHTHNVTVNNTAITLAQFPPHAHGSGVGLSSGDDVGVHGNQTVTPTGGTAGATENVDSGGGAPTNESITESVGGGDGHNHTASTDDPGGHTHVIPATPAIDSRPPWFALAYIMKS